MLSRPHVSPKSTTRCTSQPGAKRVFHAPCSVQAKAVNSPGPPANAGEVVSWAQQQFLQEVCRAKPDGSISLAKACMLLALEEEAATQLEAAPSATARTSATASTWSLTRLDALAAEVVDTLTALHHDTQQTSTPTGSEPTAASASAGSNAASSSQPGSTADGNEGGAGSTSGSSESSDSGGRMHTGQQQQQQQEQQARQAALAAGFAAVRQQAQCYPMQVLSAVNAVLFQRHGYSACNRFGGRVDSQLSTVMEDGPGSVAALTILYLEVCSRLGLDCGVKVVEEGRYCLVWPRPPAPPQATQQQGQGQSAQQGPGQQQLDTAAQPVQLEASPPPQQQQQQQQQQTLLSVGGDACVVDVYGEGALLPVREASELFGITPQELLAGSSRRELLAALLLELQTAHWCAAVGCSPTPALMTPLTAATAVGQGVRTLHGASIERAAAAAAKRVALLPQDPEAQLSLALLSYFAGAYEDAWLELGSYLEQLQAAAAKAEAAAAAAREQGMQEAGVQGSQPDPAGGSAAPSSSSSTVSRVASRVTELHAAIQSMLIGGAAVPEAPPPAAALTAAEAALASADEEEGEEGRARRQQEQALSDALLLFQKLQLELMVAADKEG